MGPQSDNHKLNLLRRIAFISLFVSASCITLFVLAATLGLVLHVVFVLPLLWSPVGVVLGLYVLIGTTAIRRKRLSETQAIDLKRCSQMATASLVLSLVLVVLVALFAPPEVPTSRDWVINDLNVIGMDAYQYRLHSLSDSGEGGTYLQYHIPERFKLDTLEGLFYRVRAVYSDSLLLECRVQNHERGSICVKVDKEGKLTNWQFYGDMRFP